MKNTLFIHFLKYLLLFSVGGFGYYFLEIIYRGFSHFSMALCGGFCLCVLYKIFEKLPNVNLVLKCALGSLVITAAEFFCGCIVNLLLHLNVWDYSHLPLNLLGQICLPFSLIWFFLCFPVSYLCYILRVKVFTLSVFV